MKANTAYRLAVGVAIAAAVLLFRLVMGVGVLFAASVCLFLLAARRQSRAGANLA